MDLNFTGTDLCAINGTRSPPEAHYQVVVVGAGPSGIAAAIDAAKTGKTVLLVDENPVSGAAMGNDIPLYFGGRMTAATQNSARMVEAIFSSMRRDTARHLRLGGLSQWPRRREPAGSGCRAGRCRPVLAGRF